MNKRSFGQYLVNEGFITKDEHEKAYLLQNKSNLFGEIAIEMNFLKKDDLPVIENGHFKERFHVKPEKLRKSFKTLLKKEFPRSKKIRLYVMDKFVEEEALKTKRKIL